MTARDVRPGLPTGAVAVLTVLTAAAEVAFLAQRDGLLLRLVMDERLARALVGGFGGAMSLLVLGGVFLLWRGQRMGARAVGRARVLLLGSGALLHALSVAGAVTVAVGAGIERSLESGLGLSLPPEVALPIQVLSGIASVSGAVALGTAVACFWLLSPAVRTRLWWLVDVALVFAVAYAVWKLPVRPLPQSPDALGLPVTRHTTVTLALLRLTVRLMPVLLNGVESFGFKPLVAARHLRAKKSGFLAAISLLSVLAVTVSCMALTTTLSVMGGFRNDLKRKILGNNAHIVIDRDHKNIEGWERLVTATRGVGGVAGVSPYVRGEVMLSSASNLATAVLRGIDPATVGEVNDLPDNIRTGDLSYLTDPEKLLELPADRLRTRLLPMLAPQPSDDAAAVADATAPVDAGVAAAAVATADAGPGAPAPAAAPSDPEAQQKLRLQKRIEDLERFLRETPPVAEAEARDVLPGIVIGQELARALRLFVGDEVNVVAPLGALGPSGPMPKARAYRVAGIFYSGMYEYDMKFTYVTLDTAQRFLGVGDAISGIEVRVDDVERAPQIAAAVRSAVERPELRVRDWQELNSRLFGALALEKLAMFIALGIAILVASFCIAGTLTLMVQEKGREVAILKAMGTSDRAVVGVFVIEGGLIGVLGAALGLFLGYMACFAAEHFGIRMNPEVYYIDRLPVHVDPTEFALTGVAAVIVCLLVTVYPALLASRLRPVDALRYE